MVLDAPQRVQQKRAYFRMPVVLRQNHKRNGFAVHLGCSIPERRIQRDGFVNSESWRAQGQRPICDDNLAPLASISCRDPTSP